MFCNPDSVCNDVLLEEIICLIYHIETKLTSGDILGSNV